MEVITRFSLGYTLSDKNKLDFIDQNLIMWDFVIIMIINNNVHKI